jgi:tetratricopeptide (TPR) repeat protein
LLLGGGMQAWSATTIAHAQTPAAGQAQPKKKKLPPGAKGFEQYAGRDASDKLITGGATRGLGDMSGAKPDASAEAIERGTSAYIIASDKEQAGQKQEANAQYKLAMEAFKQATVANPKSFKAWASLGWVYESQKMYKEAADAYQHAIKLTPAPPGEGEDSAESRLLSAYFNLGNSLASAGQHQESIATFQQIASKAPKAPTPYYNIGLSYAALGDQAQAIKFFQQALDLFKARAAADPEYQNPTFELTYYNLGVAYSKTEQYAPAAEAFKQALALAPEHVEAHYNLGLVYYMMDNRAGLAEQQKALQAAKPELAKELAGLAKQMS